jgi:hypothetical protein
LHTPLINLVPIERIIKQHLQAGYNLGNNDSNKFNVALDHQYTHTTALVNDTPIVHTRNITHKGKKYRMIMYRNQPEHKQQLVKIIHQ